MRQLHLPGLGLPDSQDEVPRHRLFYAILLPERTSLQAMRITQELRSGHELYGAPLEIDRLHISLLWLGDFARFPSHLARCARTRANALRTGRFTACFDLVSSMDGRSRKPRRCAIALRDSTGGAGVKDLQRQLCSLFGIEREHRFTPHVTLLYDKQHVAEEIVGPLTWRVDEFMLVHSRINRGRLQPYSLLDRWRLR